MTEPLDITDRADHQHIVNNGKRDLTLDQLATTQPGLDRLMAELGPRMHGCISQAELGIGGSLTTSSGRL